MLQGQALRDLASSAIDISDGLISDLKHILKASDCGARIVLDELPMSQALSSHADAEQALRWALAGGEIMSCASPCRRSTAARWKWR